MGRLVSRGARAAVGGVVMATLAAWPAHAADAVGPATTPAEPPPSQAEAWLDRGLDVAEQVTTRVGTVARPVRLRLHGGRTVEGELVRETPEGLVVTLPSGETRLYTPDRVAVREDVARDRSTLLPRSTLLLSVLWPGAGQVAYGLVVQKGKVWTRSALAPGIALVGLGLLGWVGALAGTLVAVSGLERTAIRLVNPLTVAGVGLVALAWGAGLVDAGVRAVGADDALAQGTSGTR